MTKDRTVNQIATGSAAVDALVRSSLAEGNGVSPSSEPASIEMTLPMSDTVRHAGENDPTLNYAQTLGEVVPHEGFVDEARDVIVTFPFSPVAIAAARAELGQDSSWRTASAVICAAIGGAAVWKEAHRESPNTAGVVIGLLFLVVAILLFRNRPRVGKAPDPD